MGPLTTDLLWLFAGLVLLLVGGDLLVRGAVAIARRLHISPLMIGLTLVGFGTSTPELLASLQAALAGSPGIAIGNVVGSNTANILLILGFAALLAPLRTEPEALRRDGGAMLIAALACTAAVLLGSVERWTGGLLVALLALYVVYTYRRERKTDDASARMHEHEAAAVAAQPAPARLAVALAFGVGGLAAMILGARALVTGAVSLAGAAGISETVIGLTVVAVGTSMPELVTSLLAARRGQGDIAFGNILGSNIFNVLGILGVTALVQPIAVPPEVIRLDIWVMLAATVLLLVFSATGGRLNRSEGGIFLLLYIVYTGYLIAG